MSGSTDHHLSEESPSMHKMKKTIAVIGAGSSGIAAVKSCKEEGLDVVCYERAEGLGGLWRYHEESLEGLPSVMKSTVINTHKDMSAFSDFPPPIEYPNYMHHSLMLHYFQMYVEHFGIGEYIRYNQEVVQVVQSIDYADTGQWLVKVKDLKTGITSEETFDGVMICTGHHVYPNIPEFKGQEDFQGIKMHSHSLKVSHAFNDLNVLVVGIGNSAMDAAVEISNVAKKVYLSSRRGGWVLPRSGPRGLPNDALFNCRLMNSFQNLFGWRASSWLMETFVLDWRFDHSLYGLKPDHRFQSQHPTINDYLPGKIITGRIVVKKNVKEFSKEAVLFEDENAFTPIEAVVFATGYSIRFPFLDNSVLTKSGNETELYKFTFPPNLKHPSLGVIGMIQPHGSIFPIAESQSRWYALVQTGKVRLPDVETMKSKISQRRKQLAERFVQSPRHTIQVDFVQFMDDVAVEYGAKPNMWKLLLCDPLLFWVCLVGPCFPYQYRLRGPHSWAGARNAILEFPDRFSKPLSGGVHKSRYGYSESLRVFWVLPALIFLIFSCIIYFVSILYSFT